MKLYKKYTNEIKTLHLLSQIIGKLKLEYAVQEPQWAHVILGITPRGFTTGLLKLNEVYFEIEVDLIRSQIILKLEAKDWKIKLEDGKTISDYYDDIMGTARSAGLSFSINTRPQEMDWTVPFEEDTTHHHYSEEAAYEILRLFQFAWDAEQQFIAPLRQRKVYPGLFWGTFDVSCILIYNELEAFSDDSKIIERGAFDEYMIEFGFWLGDEQFDYPTFFTLPYPFVQNVELPIDESFPKGSYFSVQMAEYLYEMKDGLDQADSDKVVQFIEASCRKSMSYLQWEDTDHIFEELKMGKNKR